jgi:hypothetical protein
MPESGHSLNASATEDDPAPSSRHPVPFRRANTAPIPAPTPQRPNLARSASTRLLLRDVLPVNLSPDAEGIIHLEEFHGFLQPTKTKDAWVPDDSTQGCQRCRRSWSSLARRRHHCRYCGGLFCNDCTPHRCTFRQDSAPERVCVICLSRIAGRIESSNERRLLRQRLNVPASGGAQDMTRNADESSDRAQKQREGGEIPVMRPLEREGT